MSESVEGSKSVEALSPQTKKRKIERSKKVPNESILGTNLDVEATSPDTATDRRVGRMSLRPNRRVNVHASYLEFNELAQDEKENEEEDEEIDDFINELDDDETLDFIPELQTKADFKDLEQRTQKESCKRKRTTIKSKSIEKLHKRRKLKHKIQKPFEKQEWDTSINYNLLKDSICVGCSKEIEKGKQENSKDLFTDKTGAGSSLHDVFVSIIETEVSQNDYGKRLCRKCCLALEQIEFYYHEWRSLVDGFRDTFILGQKNLDFDLGGWTNHDGENEQSSVIQTMDMCKNAVVKILHNDSLQSFSLQGIGMDDFHCSVKEMYRVSVQPLNQDSQYENDTDLDVGEEDYVEIQETENVSNIQSHQIVKETEDMIEINLSHGEEELSQKTPRSKKTSYANFERAAINSNDQLVSATAAMANGASIIYMLQDEWEGMQRKMKLKGRQIIIPEDEFCLQIDPSVLMGHVSTNYKTVLSKNLTNEYKKYVPSAKHRFTCADCGASFHHFHILSNHIQLAHMTETPSHNLEDIVPSSENAKLEEQSRLTSKGRNVKILSNNLPDISTGDVPSLDKPFQCDKCEKCFRTYLNFSNHVDHYHGFSRACNVDGCAVIGRSLQDFVEHYVKHGNSNFMLPENFQQKQKLLLACPLCSINIVGVWKFFQHTYVHDKEPRFKCPVCPKRTHKVQNFRDHILRHRGSTVTKMKTCPFCRQEFNASEVSAHIRESHKEEKSFSCSECDVVFSSQIKLEYHKEKHLPKHLWSFTCTYCDTTFPSQARMKLHIANMHNSRQFKCIECGEVLANRSQLQEHMSDSHSTSQFSLYLCSECNTKEFSLSAALDHYRLDHQDMPYICAKCKVQFDNEQNLHTHLTTEHPELVGPETTSTCLHCAEYFPKPVSRLRHIRLAHMVETFELDPPTNRDDITTTDMIFELDKESQKVVRLYSIP